MGCCNQSPVPARILPSPLHSGPPVLQKRSHHHPCLALPQHSSSSACVFSTPAPEITSQRSLSCRSLCASRCCRCLVSAALLEHSKTAASKAQLGGNTELSARLSCRGTDGARSSAAPPGTAALTHLPQRRRSASAFPKRQRPSIFNAGTK